MQSRMPARRPPSAVDVVGRRAVLELRARRRLRRDVRRGPAQPRPALPAARSKSLRAVVAAELGQRQSRPTSAFLTQGITFTVYGDDAGHRADLSRSTCCRASSPPREWATLERGLTQRLTAINLFLKDIYHEGRILAEGVVPRELVYSCRHYRREMRGVHVHRDIYVSVAGTDLVRLEDGRFVVLEDNLRVPSGVSYMLANREVTKRVFPGLFDRYQRQPDRALRPGAARDAARAGAAERRRTRRSSC